jgi:hypothetical protein
MEQRWMDEHIVLDQGQTVLFKEHMVDHNLNSIHWWVSKHNNYAIREMVEMLNIKYNIFQSDARLLADDNTQARRKRWLKERVYILIPPGLRAFSYFIYRYFLRLGFLDGYYGFVFHFFQGFWYRLLVDVNVAEAEKALGADKSKENILRVLKTHFNIEVP